MDAYPMTRQERREKRQGNKKTQFYKSRTGRTVNGRRMTGHHLRNKTHGGEPYDYNMLVLEEERHRAWHKLFGNADPYEAIEIIRRMVQMKGYEW